MGGSMTNNIFNSTFEFELRVLLLLSAARKKAFAIERIVSLDFIVCYAGNFQMPYLNPQGDNQYMFSELASRREHIRDAIKSLVMQGLIEVSLDNGYVFNISEAGSTFIKKLKSEYATQYKKIAADAIKQFKNYSDLELDRMLHESSVKAVKGGR